MKTMMIVMLCAASLVLPASAQAYAIYNHVDHKVCVQNFGDQWLGDCLYSISAHGKHNGKHGAGLHNVFVSYKTGHKCRGTKKKFSIPKGGFARIYDNEVKIYKHDGKRVDRKSIHECDCPK